MRCLDLSHRPAHRALRALEPQRPQLVERDIRPDVAIRALYPLLDLRQPPVDDPWPPLGLARRRQPARLAAFDSTWGLARLRPDGRLDTGFGAGGMVRSDRYGEVSDLLAQADGRLVVAGRSSPGGRHDDAMLVRYRRDGRLDRGFGTGGIVTTDIAESTDGAAAVTLGPDRTLVIAGSTEPIPFEPPHADLLVARYHR
jgi:uncharacterized delta-60 repeat protein